MNRRNFLAFSGSALGALLLNGPSALAAGDPLMQLPSAAFVVLEDGRYPMTAAGTGRWTFKDVTIMLQHVDESLQVRIGSPTLPLCKVELEWTYAMEKGPVLGDHWERSYGDLQFMPADFNRRMPWYFIAQEPAGAVCIGLRTGCATICSWQAGSGRVRLTLDARNGAKGVLLKDRLLTAGSVVTTRSQSGEHTFATARRFCALMCPTPRLPKQPVYGINDWYVTYGANSSRIILDHTARMTGLAPDTTNRPFSVVDSGWAAYSPLLPNDCCWQDDYSRPNEHFKDMGLLAQEINKLGMRPGLWTRPLCASHDDKPALLLPSIPGRDSPKKPVLDPSIDENLQRIARNIALYRAWGYELVKHDFTTYDIWGKWGFQMTGDVTSPGWAFSDRSRTTAEIVLSLYQTIRKAAGDMYLLGCNTFSHLSAGLFEVNRIGDDTSGKEWERTRKMGVNTLGFRLVQHQKFYSADGDCVGLTNAVPWAKNKLWMDLLARSSSPLFISAQESATGAEQKAFIRQSFAAAAVPRPVAEPLDWLTTPLPRRWKMGGETVTYDWD